MTQIYGEIWAYGSGDKSHVVQRVTLDWRRESDHIEPATGRGVTLCGRYISLEIVWTGMVVPDDLCKRCEGKLA